MSNIKIMFGFVFVFLLHIIPTTYAQNISPSTDVCTDVRYLMTRDITPYDMALGGGNLQAGQNVQSTIAATGYADFWSFGVQRPVNANQVAQPVNILLNMTTSSGAVEYAIYSGMKLEMPFQVEPTANMTFTRDGVFTVVVRRINLADETPSSYSLTLNTPQPQGIIAPTIGDVRDETVNQAFGGARLANGLLNLSMPSAAVTAHPLGILRVNPRGGVSTQVRFPDEQFGNSSAYTLHIGGWANQLRLLGGDLAASGPERTYYLKNYAYNFSISGTSAAELDLTAITYPDGTVVRLDWTLIQGIWVDDTCTGVKLRDNRTFIAATPATEREVRFEGNTLEVFPITINALTADGTPTSHRIDFSWTGVTPESEVSLLGGVLDMDFIDQRDFSIRSTDVMLNSDPSPDGVVPGLLNAELRDLGARIVLDWTNMQGFRMESDVINLTFQDKPRSTTTRSAVGLSLFEALNDVIRIQYKEAEDGTQGSEHLLLPASDSYLEVVTPPGMPPIDGRALPDQPGYVPRALNNTGGECYPVNTVLPMANCPPSGEANLANGNLWYTVTDHHAPGYQLDLDLTRSYNSRLSHVDGPFGYGWFSNYLIDFPIAFDPVTNSRLIDPAQTYAVGLDVTYAPRGVVTFFTASGSRHQFVTQETPFIGGEMRTLTMPGWTLSRDGYRDPEWELRQDNGLVLFFDRAGRLLRFGRPADGRMIQIDYPYTLLNGAGELGESVPVIIRDIQGETPLRQLELYYNADGHIGRSILRDLTTGTDPRICDIAENCFENVYTYQNGWLKQVAYANGQVATYRYEADSTGAFHLVEHNDPRSTTYRHMRYAYDEDSNVASAVLVTGEGEIPYRAYTTTVTDTERSVIMTDELGNSVTYTYQLEDAQQFAHTNSYTLIEETSPLSEVDEFEAVPIQYVWENGLLRRVAARTIANETGRNGVGYDYTVTGQITCIACSPSGLPPLRIEYVQPPEVFAPAHQPEVITYADGSTEEFAYDEATGHIIRFKDRQGRVYLYTWQPDALRVQSVLSEGDGVTWTYTYNAAGMVTEISRVEAPGAAPHVVRYQWDGLSRLKQIEDSVLGVYSIAYPPPQPDANGQVFTEMHLTDPLGVETVLRFDPVAQLVERSINNNKGALERQRYAYDIFGRLTAVARLIDPSAGEGQQSEHIVTYNYTPLPSLPPLTQEGAPIDIRGYSVQVVQPGLGTQIYSYDALHRLRRFEDERQRVTDYEYTYRDLDIAFGQMIRQQTLIGGEITPGEVTYLFDARRQLRDVQAGEWRWLLNADGDSARHNAMQPSVGGQAQAIISVNWGNYVNGKPEGVSVVQAPLFLRTDETRISQHNPTLGATYDGTARPTTIRDGSGERHITYCPQPDGNTRILYSHLNSPAVTCDATGYALALTQDTHRRVVAVEDETGIRQFRYATDTEAQQWVVNATFSAVDGTSSTWQMRFDTLGNLLYWRDENGVERTYTYDSLDRLNAVTVAGYPEASYTFEYNEAGMLTKRVDGLGRGYQYNYNDQGQVVSQVDLNTADAVTYAYNPAGMMSLVISSQGNTNSFFYENNPLSFDRPVRIVEPTGSQHTYQWLDSENERGTANALIYTDPLGNQTTYHFDGTETLWMVEGPLFINDAERRTHELHYDDNARLTDWYEDTRRGGRDWARRLVIDRTGNHEMTLSETSGNVNWSQPMTFTSFGQLRTVGGLTFGYDPLGRLLAINSGEATWQFERQDQQRQLTYTDPYAAGAAPIVWEYDALYRLIRQQNGAVETRYTYTPNSEFEAVDLTIERTGRNARTYRFSPGNTSELPNIVLFAHGQEIRYQFNGDKQLTSIRHTVCNDPNYVTLAACEENTDTSETTVNFIYDASNRPVRLVYEDGSSETFAYDDVGNLRSYQTTNGRTFNYIYDSAHRLIAVNSPTGVKLLLKYDRFDRVAGVCRTRVEAPNRYATCAESGGELEIYAHDPLGRMASRSFVAGGTEATMQYTYNNNRLGYGPNGSELVYELDGLGLLQRLITPEQNHVFTYSALNQLASAGDLAYTYDGAGDVLSVRSGGNTLTYDTAVDGSLRVTDANGLGIQYQLEPRGFLSSVGTANTPDPILNITYTTPQDLLVNRANAFYFNQDQRFTPRHQLYDNLYANQDYSDTYQMQYDMDQASIVRRQTVTLPNSSSKFSIVTGYDSDDRPVTMRVTDASQYEVLYVQSINYTNSGLRDSETRQYADGTQTVIDYQYETDTTSSFAGNRVTRVRIDIVRPIGLSAGFVLAFFWMLLSFRRTHRRMLVVVVLCAGLGFGLLVLAQQELPLPQMRAVAGENYALVYSYDNTGNLMKIENERDGTTCRTFTYDARNNLTQITHSDGTQTTYGYDAYGRVTQVDSVGLMYWGDSQRLAAVNNGGTTNHYGQLADQPPAFVANDQQVMWLMNDGKDRITQVTPQKAEPTSDVWLFDPLQRYVSLQAPTIEFDPCRLTETPSSIPGDMRLQPLQDGSVWDSTTNLYFMDGRVYDPEIGRYLQRDPLGPDALGMVYGYPSRTTTPPVRERPPAHTDGLYLLREAMTVININDTLTAEAVRAEYGVPHLPPDADIYQLQEDGRTAFDQTMMRLFNLPTWLEGHYNVPAARLNPMTGALQMPTHNTPGQGVGQHDFAPPFHTDLPTWESSLMTSIQTPDTYAGELALQSIPLHTRHYTTYVPQQWQNHPLGVWQLWGAPAVPVQVNDQPSAVLQWLPRTLEDPTSAAAVLETVQVLKQMPYQTPHDWVNTYVATAQPDLPALPVSDSEAWKTTFFSDDTLGVNRGLIDPMPAMPEVPMYAYGVNTTWLHNLEP